MKFAEKIRKVTIGQGDDYATVCLLDYPYLKKNCLNTIGLSLSKQQAFDADLKAIQQINFAGKINKTGNTTIFFILEEVNEEVKETVTVNSNNIIDLIIFNLIFIDTRLSLLNTTFSNAMLLD